MALLKTVKTQFGIDATYWNILSFNEDFKNKTLAKDFIDAVDA